MMASDDIDDSDKGKGPTKEIPTVTQLGLGLSPITPEARQKYQLGNNVSGVLVVSVAQDSAAADKGLSPGDVLTEVNQDEVKTPKDVVAKIEEARKAGKKSVLLMIVSEGGDEHFVALPLAKKD
jgi:serine protease Do